MSTVVANAELLAVLRAAKEPLELIDPDGKIVGIFSPTSNHVPIGKKAIPGKLYTTREVFEHLKTQTNDPIRLADLQSHIDSIDARSKE